MQRRVFIAINLPNQTRERILREAQGAATTLEKHLGKNIHLTHAANLHFTILFLGEQDDDSVARTAALLKETAQRFASPRVRFVKLVYGPTGRTPRMLWVIGDGSTSKNLGSMRDILSDELLRRNVRFEPEHRAFHAHLTLARFSTARALPPFNASFDISFQPSSIELMESFHGRGGGDYMVVQSAPFARNH